MGGVFSFATTESSGAHFQSNGARVTIKDAIALLDSLDLDAEVKERIRNNFSNSRFTSEDHKAFCEAARLLCAL